MAKKTATKEKPVRGATRATKKSAKKSAKKASPGRAAGEPTIPPAETPELPPAIEKGSGRKKSSAEVQAGFSGTEKDAEAAVVAFLQRRNFKINRSQWNKLSSDDHAQVRRWMEDVEAGRSATVPPCLLQFNAAGQATPGGAVQPVDESEIFKTDAEFGRVSYEDTGSVPVTIPKDDLEPDEAEALFCDSKLGVLIELRPNSERKTLLAEPTKPRLEFVIDVKGYRSSKDGWHFTMKFGIALDYLEVLGKFAGKSGRCELRRLGSAEAKGSGGKNRPHPDVEAGKDRPHGLPALEAAAAARRESNQPKLIPDEEHDIEGVAELFVLPQTASQTFVARVKQFPDGKWRVGAMVSFSVPGDPPVIDENTFPEAGMPGCVSVQQAIASIIERWIGYLQKSPYGGADEYIDDLQAYLTRLRGGDTPEQIDQELTAASGESSPTEGAADGAGTPDGADAVSGGDPAESDEDDEDDDEFDGKDDDEDDDE